MADHLGVKRLERGRMEWQCIFSLLRIIAALEIFGKLPWIRIKINAINMVPKMFF